MGERIKSLVLSNDILFADHDSGGGIAEYHLLSGGRFSQPAIGCTHHRTVETAGRNRLQATQYRRGAGFEAAGKSAVRIPSARPSAAEMMAALRRSLYGSEVDEK